MCPSLLEKLHINCIRERFKCKSNVDQMLLNYVIIKLSTNQLWQRSNIT